MSGLVKAKKYDWKDSNMALFGSDTEKQVKKESAESEPAWKGAGQTVGLQIWRINKFKVENWAKEEYGQFFNGDSYIILNTYKDQDSDELHYDVHFWIGRYSTQDEYGTAAYKTVELDTLLDDKPVQHREVEGHESQLFKSYFSEIRTMSGGADSGFRHVGPKEVKTRLLHFKKTGRKVVITEIEKRCRRKLTSGDVFILQTADCLYQWNGKDCSKDEKFRAVQTLQEMYSAKSGLIPKETLDEDDTAENHKFYTYLDEEDDGDDDQDAQVEMEPKLFKVSDADGSLDMDPVKEGDISMDDFDSNDVMIVDAGEEVTVWIGSGASEAEKKNGLSYAHNYLKQTDRCWPSITVYKEGQVGNRTIPGVA